MRKYLGTWRKHPRSRYPLTWDRIARRIKRAAGWRCERCRHPQRPDGGQLACDDRCRHEPCGTGVSPVEIFRILTVHHLDGNRANNAWWNLAALCQRCHLSVQSTIDFDQAVLFPDQYGDWFIGHLQGYLRDRRRRALGLAG